MYISVVDSSACPSIAWMNRMGDQAHRFLGLAPMLLKVSKLTRDRIVCGAWEFDRATGAEIDEDLGWGPGGTRSWICPVSH